MKKVVEQIAEADDVSRLIVYFKNQRVKLLVVFIGKLTILEKKYLEISPRE